MVATTLLVALEARPALAQRAAPAISEGLDEVILKNGGMLRGTVVTIEPDKAVTLFVMLTGEQRSVPWAEVERVERGKHAPSCEKSDKSDKGEKSDKPAEPAERERDLEAALARDERGVVRVHIDSTEPGIQLYRVNTTGSNRAQVNPGGISAFPMSDLLCISPCDKIIDGRLGEQYFFGAQGMSPSSPFQVYQRRGEVSAHVEPGSDARLITGVALGTAGGITAMAGGAVWLLGYIEGDQQKRNADGTPMVTASGGIIIEHGPYIPSGRVAGPITFGLGAAALAIGIVLGRSGEMSYTLSSRSTGTSIALSPAGVAVRF